ncbi:MAG: ISNCY family transposase [Dehalococcoidales bacterium]|nr:ISNCY family transposase [Dehalococcoidales bacterium]
MTRRSIREYAEAVRGRYLRSSKVMKTVILDEFVATTGLHRKAAIRLLNRRGRPVGRKSGRPRIYSLEAMAALRVVWEATDRLCSKRFRPFVPELVGILKRKGELTVTEEAEIQLCRMSPSTIDRILRPWRRHGPRHGLGTTKPGTLLKNAIPVRTFSEWNESKPGFLEVDLVAHCGDSAEGFYLTTLSAVDVATGWYEPVAVWGKGQDRVGGAVYDVRHRLPMPMLGLDSDNGGEFINHSLYDYCRRNNITFTRSRSYKKNDSCHVEQKNWSVVRRTVGYDRFISKAAFKALDDVYTCLRLYINFFQPVLKLVGKSRRGAKVRKVYDTAQTPYQRLLKSEVLTEPKKRELAAIYAALNPVILLKQIRQEVEHLWTLAEPSPGSIPVDLSR